MTEYKTIVCLANSIKHGGRCVAGIEVSGDRSAGWVRPVSARDGHAVSLSEMRLQDGVVPAALDVIRLAVVGPSPTDLQPENWLLDNAHAWEKVDEWPWDALADLVTELPSLWGTGNSSGKGENDRVLEESADFLGQSIALVWVDQLTLRVLDGGFHEVKREVRARFQFAGQNYDLKVSDPTYKSAYLQEADGTYVVEGCYLTVSLAEPFSDGHCYKVVAAIIESTRTVGEG